MTTNLVDFDAKRVKDLRQRMGLTQVQFAEQVGVSQRAVSGWESGERTPSRAETLWRLYELERGL